MLSAIFSIILASDDSEEQLIFNVFVCRSGGWRQRSRSTGFLCKSFSKDHPTVSKHTCTRVPPLHPPSPFTFLTAPCFCIFFCWPLFSPSLSLSLSFSLCVSGALLPLSLFLTLTHSHSCFRLSAQRANFAVSANDKLHVFKGGTHLSAPAIFFPILVYSHMEGQADHFLPSLHSVTLEWIFRGLLKFIVVGCIFVGGIVSLHEVGQNYSFLLFWYFSKCFLLFSYT